MSDFLTENATFGCSVADTKISIRASGKATFRGAKVVTADDWLVIEQQPTSGCPLLSGGGTPVPCCFTSMSVAALLQGQSSKVGQKNSPLMLDSARGSCPQAQVAKIFVKDHRDTNSQFMEGSGGRGNISGREKSPQANSTAAPETASPGEEQQAGEEDPGDAAEAQKDPLASPVVACQDCQEQEECETLKRLKRDWEEHPYKNDSQLLKRNYEKRIAGNDEATEPAITAGHRAHQLYDASQKALEQASGESPPLVWGYEAHHVLSGNEIVQSSGLEDLLALIRISGFDINSADNCIMLPGKNSQRNQETTYGKMNLEGKREVAFETMARTRLQWHRGSHDKGIAKELEKYRQQIVAALPLRHLRGQEHRIDTYANLLREQFRALTASFREEPVCPRDKQARLENFVRELKQKIEAVRMQLVKFAEKPHHSFPYFVSMEAWRYAFLLPRVEKLIAITAYGDQYRFQQFRLTRFADTLRSPHDWPPADGQNEPAARQLAVKAVSGPAATLICSPGKDNIPEYVRFCSNYNRFALGGGVDARVAGFEIPEAIIFRIPGQNPQEELQQRETGLLIWLLGLKEDDDSPALATALARKKEAEEYFSG